MDHKDPASLEVESPGSGDHVGCSPNNPISSVMSKRRSPPALAVKGSRVS